MTQAIRPATPIATGYVHQRATRAEVYHILYSLSCKASMAAILDEMAQVCADRAAEVEPLDRDLSDMWDALCGKIAVTSNTSRV